MGPWLVGVAFVDQRWGIGQLLAGRGRSAAGHPRRLAIEGEKPRLIESAGAFVVSERSGF